MELKSREHCKIRKRGNSSSSSSSIVQRYRFKRAILAGKRGGSSTPVPTWKTSTKSPTLSIPNAESTKCPPSPNKEASISARKLAATLWEINKIPAPKDIQLVRDTKKLRSREKVAKFPHLSDPSYTPISEKMDRSRGNGHRRRASLVRKKVQLSDKNEDSVINASLTQIETRSKGKTDMVLKDVCNGLKASKELLNVLNRIWGLDEQHSSAFSLVTALGVELDRARIHVDQLLIRDQRPTRNEIECLMKYFEEEKAAWKSKERDRIRNAIACISEELQVERKLRRQTERLNKKLGMELADTKASLSQALKELESEKRAKEILEQVCDELARGIGEDRAQVEELKRESAKVKEEMEKEREMLQLADVLREERVQMKLSEARYHFEEKNAALERLRHELEAYLQEKLGDSNGYPNYERITELEAYLKQVGDDSCTRVEGEVENGQVNDGDDSADSDLHSIELNMDNNSKSYRWSYACNGIDLDNTKTLSVHRDCKGRKSISENSQWGGIRLQTKNSMGTDCPNSGNAQEIPNVFDGERLSELDSYTQIRDLEDGITQYTSVNNLSGHLISSSQNITSPSRQWGQILQLQDDSRVLQGERNKG